MNTHFIELHRNFGENFYVNSRLPLCSFEFDEHLELFDVIFNKKDSLYTTLKELSDKIIADKINPYSGLSYLYNSGNTDVENVFSNSHRFYNILSDELFCDEPIIQRFKSFLRECCESYAKVIVCQTETFYAKVWINVMNKWDYLASHSHTSIYNNSVSFCCHYDLSIPTPETYTCFMPIYNDWVLETNENIVGSFRKKNKDGDLVCFPFFLPHRTTPNKSNMPRYTLGIDIITTEEQYMNESFNAIFVEL